jgi:L-arabinose transport system substrate-binding protein
MKSKSLRLLAPLALASLLTAACNNKGSDGKIRIGYIVKDGTAEWFRNEIKFAKEAGVKDGFEVIEKSAADGSEVMNALDLLAAKGCKATVICSPDVKLGPAIAAACKEKNLKLVSVDDRLVDASGKPLADVPHVGISATAIGRKVGTSLWEEAKKRGWDPATTGVLALTHEQLPTAQERVVGAMAALKEAGMPAAQIHAVAQPEQTLASANNAAEPVLQQHPEYKQWLVCGMNDDAVLGAMRRLEKDVPVANIVGIGINGDANAINEFKSATPTGFFGSIQLEARTHGEGTARMAFKWVKTGETPPAETLTAGVLMTRENYQTIRKEQGLE